MVLRSGVHGFLTLTSLVLRAASLPTCPDTSKSDFDFVVVGSGVGGGPLAARLAQSGFSGNTASHSDGYDLTWLFSSPVG